VHPSADVLKAFGLGKLDENSAGEVVLQRLAKLGPNAEPAMHDLADTLTNARHPTKIRVLAALALASIGPKAQPVVPAIVKALKRSQPLEIRQAVAEALAQIKYPANKESIPGILDAIENDTDPAVRQKCIWALFGMDTPEFKRLGADKLLEKMLDEHDENMTLARYDAARKLAEALGEEAPDKTADVLLEMLRNPTLRIYNGTDVKEKSGRAQPNADIGGDARQMAAKALSWLGKKVRGRTDIIDALKAATKDTDPRLREEAAAALKELGVP
jgi:HEAT repeat protein